MHHFHFCAQSRLVYLFQKGAFPCGLIHDGPSSCASSSLTRDDNPFCFGQTGLSPLAPGQWKNFLAVYAGFWVMNNFLRPLRVTAAVAISTQVDKIVKAVQDKLKVKRAAAVGICVFLANVVGTLSVTALGIILAATLSQTPIFPPKV